MNEDRIDRSIEINAPATTVWNLISEPGWWINDGVVVAHTIEPGEGEVVTVHDPKHGAFAVRTESLRAPHFAAFRWMSTGAGDTFDLGSSTLVEFEIDEVGDGVVLRVAESGFTGLPIEASERRTAFDSNTEGWKVELEAARVSIEEA